VVLPCPFPALLQHYSCPILSPRREGTFHEPGPFLPFHRLFYKVLRTVKGLVSRVNLLITPNGRSNGIHFKDINKQASAPFHKNRAVTPHNNNNNQHNTKLFSRSALRSFMTKLTVLLAACLSLQGVSALWPIPAQYSQGNDTLWLSSSVSFEFGHGQAKVSNGGSGMGCSVCFPPLSQFLSYLL